MNRKIQLVEEFLALMKEELEKGNRRMALDYLQIIAVILKNIAEELGTHE